MKKIKFDEKNHIYQDEKGFIIPSVTEVIGKVYGTGLENAPAHLVKARADIGSEIHKEAKDWQDGKISVTEMKHKESAHFASWFFNESPKYNKSEFIAYASTPFGEICGTVDLFADGYIYDLKTSKTATRKQLEKWQMQLSFYCYMLKQEGKSVLGMKVLHLTEDKREEIPLEYLGDDFVEATMKLFKEGQTVQPTTSTELQTIDKSDIEYFQYALETIAKLEQNIEGIREAIKAEMEERNILALKIGNVDITYVAPTKRKSFDSTKFKAEHADLYKFYQKESEVKSSIRIKVK